MSGTIGVLSLELARYATFGASLACLKRPPDTAVVWSMGKSVIDAQNWLVRKMVGDWLFILGDDHQFGEDSLMSLLDHDADVICPVNVMRCSPFGPLIFGEEGTQLTWQAMDGKRGTLPVPACGNAGMLIKRHVFEKIPAPWFSWAPKGCPYQGSDLAFCWKARKAGFKVHIDTDVRFGHTTVCTFIPAQDAEGKWGVWLQVQGQNVAFFRFGPNQDAIVFDQRGFK